MNTARLFLLRRLVSTFATFTLVGASACGGSTSNDDHPEGDSGASPDSGGAAHDSGGVVQGDASAQDAGVDSGSGLEKVTLSACVPTIYTAPTTIGTQSFQLIFDTGSTTLAVAGSTCSCMTAMPLYTPGPTAVDQKQTVMANYGSGSWNGEIYQDSITLGTTPSTQTKFASMTSETGFFQSPPPQCDSMSGGTEGLIGFGPSGAASQGTVGFFDAYVAAHNVPDVFSIQLCDTSGSLWLGGFDPASMTAAPQYVPLDKLQVGGQMLDQLYYAIDFVSITVNGTNVPVGANGQVPDAVVDTGTSAFLLSDASYAALTAAIQADSAFNGLFGASFFPTAANSLTSVTCKQLSQTKAQLDAMLPPLTLTFGGNVTVQALPTESYLASYDGEWCSTLAGDTSGLGGLAGIMGAPVLRSNVVIYDRAQERIGFAPHAPCQ
jgi:hypothetical protein